MNDTIYISKKYIDNSTSIYFVTHNSSIGSTNGVWFGSGYTMLSIKVQNSNGEEFILKLRANNNSYQMNAGQNANWDNTLKITYNQDDNPNIPSGTHLKSLEPVTIDALKWHKGGEIVDRIYLNIDFITP